MGHVTKVRHASFFEHRSDQERVKHYLRLANQGVSRYQHNLGVAHIHAFWGLEKDHEKAVDWFRRAANRGFRDSIYELAICYKDGESVAPNLIMARELFHQAALLGHRAAQMHLGLFHRDGKGGLSVDMDAAVYWLTLAASHAPFPASKDKVDRFKFFARRYLACMYNIELVERDGSLELAKYWFQKALQTDTGDLDQDTTKKVMGSIQYGLALTLMDLYRIHYCSCTAAGRPLPFPQVLRLLGRAHENGVKEAAEKAKRIQEHAKLACAYCGLPCFITRLKLCGGCKAVYYCGRVCQKRHYKMNHGSVCNTDTIDWK